MHSSNLALLFFVCIVSFIFAERFGPIFKRVDQQTEFQPTLLPDSPYLDVIRHSFTPLRSSDDEETPDQDEDLATTTCSVTGSSVRIRDDPSLSGKILTSVYRGNQVKKLGDAGSSNGYKWIRVQYSGSKTGYTAAEFYSCSSSGGGGSSSTCSPKRHYPTFKQCDSKWGSNKLGSSSTICRVGCLMSSVSMALNGLGKKIDGHAANPGTLNRWLMNHNGYSGNLFIWSSVSRLGLNYEGKLYSKNDIVRAVCAGKIVVIQVRNRSHWVLATGVSSSGYIVNDAGYNVNSYSFSGVSEAGVFSH